MFNFEMRFQRGSQKHWVQKCSRLDDQVDPLFVILNIFYRDNVNYFVSNDNKSNVKFVVKIFFFYVKICFLFRFTLYYACDNVGRGSLSLLRHSTPYLSHFISSSGNRTHNLSHLQSYIYIHVPCATTD